MQIVNHQQRIDVAEAALRLCSRSPVTALPGVLETGAGHAFLREFSGQHQILGLVCRQLLEAPERDRFPVADTERAASLLRGLAQRETLFDLEAERMLEAMRAANLKPLPLKGWLLRREVYTHPGDRHCNDLDVLLNAEEIDGACAVLRSYGYRLPGPERVATYRLRHCHLPIYHPDGHVVEVHWDLQRKAAAFRMDVARIREGATAGEPHRADVAWHLVQQLAEDGFRQFSRLVDLDRLIASGDKEFFERLLDSRGVESLTGAMTLALRLAHETLATPLPTTPERWSPGTLDRYTQNRFHPREIMIWRTLRHRPTAEFSFLRTLLPTEEDRRLLRSDHAGLGTPIPGWKLLAFHLRLWTWGYGVAAGELPRETN